MIKQKITPETWFTVPNLISGMLNWLWLGVIRRGRIQSYFPGLGNSCWDFFRLWRRLCPLEITGWAWGHHRTYDMSETQSHGSSQTHNSRQCQYLIECLIPSSRCRKTCLWVLKSPSLLFLKPFHLSSRDYDETMSRKCRARALPASWHPMCFIRSTAVRFHQAPFQKLCNTPP